MTEDKEKAKVGLRTVIFYLGIAVLGLALGATVTFNVFFVGSVVPHAGIY